MVNLANNFLIIYNPLTVSNSDNNSNSQLIRTMHLKLWVIKSSNKWKFIYFYVQVKDVYENIESQKFKFTTKWLGALIAEVSDI